MKFIFLVVYFISVNNQTIQQNVESKESFLSAGKQLALRVDQVLKDLRAQTKPNNQLIIHLQNDQTELNTLIYILDQAKSDDNIKQIEEKLKTLELKIENEIDQANNPVITTGQSTLGSTLSSIHKSTENTKSVESSVTTTLTSVGTTSVSMTTNSVSTTEQLNSCTENQDLLTKASELIEKTKNYIKFLSDSHRISETIVLIADEKRLEQISEELTLYFNEINKLKSDLKQMELKLNGEIKP